MIGFATLGTLVASADVDTTVNAHTREESQGVSSRSVQSHEPVSTWCIFISASSPFGLLCPNGC